MFYDARALPTGTKLDCNIVIVGAGAGGMSVAHELLNTSLDVVLLESGGLGYETDTQRLCQGKVLDLNHHAPLDAYRQRRYGGTTTVWGGRCAPHDPIDFEERGHVPFSGWPMSLGDLDAYYERAHVYCDLGRYNYQAAEMLPCGHEPLIPGLQSRDVAQDWIWQFSLPSNFAKLSPAAFKTSPRMRVYLHANCLGVQMNKEGNHVAGLRVASLRHNEFTVRAKYYVLAAGGLEVPRILLSSRDVCPAGVGNDRDLVGRFYCGHVTGDLCMAKFTPKGGPIIWDYELSHDGIYCRRALRIREETQRREQLLNFRCYISHPSMADPAHGSAILSAGYLVKRFLIQKIPPEYDKALAGRMTPYKQAGPHLRNLLMGAPSLVPFSFKWLRKRILPRRKLPAICLHNKDNIYNLHFDSEQCPNPESRVCLSEEKDALGMNRLCVDWRMTNLDIESVLRCFRILDRDFRNSGVGTMLAQEAAIAEELPHRVGVGSHHYGTTRMAGDPSRGVVDANCRVYGTDNLFIATSSTFPTSSFANPVLSIVALSLRLADHLKQLG